MVVGIVEEDIVKVRESSDIVAIVSQHLALRKVGRRYQGLCPFHAEKSGSFSVNAELGLYYCFGCHAKGDVITFVREIEHLDFAAAVEWLAARSGTTLRYTASGEGEGKRRRQDLFDALSRATEWYHQRLLSGPDSAKARSYLRSRGLTSEEVRRFKIGWAPDAWDQLARAMKLPDEIWIQSGLGFINKGRRQTDAFRARILFPIMDVSGNPVAFGGRVLPGEDGPKYKNSSESAVYAKSRTLYGLNWAKAAIVQADEAVVCEGYTDVIGFHSAGIQTAVATCGTALTEEHLAGLRRFARRVVLAFDADSAGRSAAERVYEWERSHDLEIAVADLPNGVDPADLARSDPAALALSIADARPFLAFRLARVMDNADLSTPEGRVRAAEAATEALREHPSDLVRDQYLVQIADRTQVDPDRLRGILSGAEPRLRAGNTSRRAEAPSSAGHGSGSKLRESPELEALRIAIQKPDEMADWLDEALFEDGRCLSAFRALRVDSNPHGAISAADPAAADLLARLAVEQSDAEPLDVVGRLAEQAAGRILSQLQARARRDPDRALELAATIAEIKLGIEALRDQREPAEPLRRLLPLLSNADEGIES